MSNRKSASKPTSKSAGQAPTTTAPATTKKVTPKKAPAKKVAAKNPNEKKQIDKKAVSQKAVPSKTSKSAPSKPPTTKKETLSTLRAHIDDITKRLKQADSLNRKSVKSLEFAFSLLEKQVKEHQTVNHAALTRRIDQLTSQLNRSIDETKQGITADLKSALNNPTLASVEAAIGRSELRLAKAEEAQALALSKVNRHIAELARVIDARFKNLENRAAHQGQALTKIETEITSAQSQTYERIRLVEDSTANAVRQIGSDLVNTAEKFQEKLDRHSATMREKMSDIAQQTQKDVGTQNSALSQRLDRIEESQLSQSQQFEQAIANFTARVEGLEYGLTQIPETQPSIPSSAYAGQNAPPLAPAQPYQAVDAYAPIAAANPYSAPQAVPDLNPYAAPHQPLPPAEPDAFAPTENLFTPEEPAPFGQPVEYQPQSTGQFQEYQPVQPVADIAAQQHHYVDPAAQMAQMVPPSVDGNTAIAFDPFASQEIASGNPPFPQAQPVAEFGVQSNQGPIEFQPQGYQTQEYQPQGLLAPDQQAQSLQPDQFNPEALPYADPGYGEGQSVDGVSRPGHIEDLKTQKKTKKTKLKATSALSSLPITPKNLRVAGLALVLAFAGFFAVKTLMGNSGSETPAVTEMAEPVDLGAPIGLPVQPILTENPIGDYQDNQGAVVPSETAPNLESPGTEQTLKGAAEGGNPIAEFQLGVSYLDAGRTQDGLKYVRASANQGQPAAQYRLAKLYEAGIGVAADPDMARQLTERSARAGNRIAMHDLGLYYAEGRGGVERNMDTALSWFEKAAERGVVDSQYNLGVLFESSPEVPRNPASSFVWYSIAAAQGDQLAANRVDVLKGELKGDDLVQAERRVAQFKPASVDEEANGIFRQVSWVMPKGDNIAPSTELVRDAQALLGQLGYQVGTPDGDMGPKTRTAIIAFEKANGLSESGMVTSSLVDRLEAAAGV